MLEEKEDNKSNTPEWVIEGANEILKLLNYDLDKDIHEQFIQRHNLPRKEKKTEKLPMGRPRKDLPRE